MNEPLDIIYLQYTGDVAPGHEDEGVTWCEDCINDTDIEYLRATPERTAAGELLAVCVELIDMHDNLASNDYLNEWIANELRAEVRKATTQGEQNDE